MAKSKMWHSKKRTQPNWECMESYGAPVFSGKEHLWQDLRQVADRHWVPEWKRMGISDGEHLQNPTAENLLPEAFALLIPTESQASDWIELCITWFCKGHLSKLKHTLFQKPICNFTHKFYISRFLYQTHTVGLTAN